MRRATMLTAVLTMPRACSLRAPRRHHLAQSSVARQLHLRLQLPPAQLLLEQVLAPLAHVRAQLGEHRSQRVRRTGQQFQKSARGSTNSSTAKSSRPTPSAAGRPAAPARRSSCPRAVGELCLSAVRVALVDARRAGQQHVQRVRAVALLDDRAAGCQRLDLAALGQRDKLVRGQAGE